MDRLPVLFYCLVHEHFPNTKLKIIIGFKNYDKDQGIYIIITNYKNWMKEYETNTFWNFYFQKFSHLPSKFITDKIFSVYTKIFFICKNIITIIMTSKYKFFLHIGMESLEQ